MKILNLSGGYALGHKLHINSVLETKFQMEKSGILGRVQASDRWIQREKKCEIQDKAKVE